MAPAANSSEAAALKARPAPPPLHPEDEECLRELRRNWRYSAAISAAGALALAGAFVPGGRFNAADSPTAAAFGLTFGCGIIGLGTWPLPSGERLRLAGKVRAVLEIVGALAGTAGWVWHATARGEDHSPLQWEVMCLALASAFWLALRCRTRESLALTAGRIGFVPLYAGLSAGWPFWPAMAGLIPAAAVWSWLMTAAARRTSFLPVVAVVGLAAVVGAPWNAASGAAWLVYLVPLQGALLCWAAIPFASAQRLRLPQGTFRSAPLCVVPRLDRSRDFPLLIYVRR